MNREQYKRAINDVVDTLEKEESLAAVHQAALICRSNERKEKEDAASLAEE